MKEGGAKRIVHSDSNAPCKSRVKTILRVRPALPNESSRSILTVDENAATTSLANPRNPSEQLTFQFDGCWSYQETAGQQLRIFLRDIVPIAQRCLEGYNATIFAYGNTGAGKTFTMEGNQNAPGMIPLTVRFLLEKICKAAKSHNGRTNRNNNNNSTRPSLSISYLEIYREKVYDLLAVNPAGQDLAIREDINRNIIIPGLASVEVASMEEFDSLWERGVSNRRTAATRLNAHSSRSHACLTITLTGNHSEGGEFKDFRAKLHLIDLAGSEDNRKTANVGDRLAESGAINRSLFVLGQVVDALNAHNSNANTRIPYRDSKLTRLLQDSLGGRAWALLIANVAPIEVSALETLSTLTFAAKARQVENNIIRPDLIPTTTIINEKRAKDVDSSSPTTISSAHSQNGKRRQNETERGGRENNPFQSNSRLHDLILEQKIEQKIAEQLRGKLPTSGAGGIFSPLLKGDPSRLKELRSPLSKVLKRIDQATRAKGKGKSAAPVTERKPEAFNPESHILSLLPHIEPELLRIFTYGTIKEIRELNEIGPRRAQAIIAYREEQVDGECRSLREMVEAGVLSNKVISKVVLANAALMGGLEVRLNNNDNGNLRNEEKLTGPMGHNRRNEHKQDEQYENSTITPEAQNQHWRRHHQPILLYSEGDE